ncbi:DUF4369 domain-containing protein [Spirosoma soli]|uniref:DUF4369 domain-containing protein n=1 Tax=Spirosoma soli TaxID=1770529 RepID=A0ABW5MCV6_9BACT
MKGAVFSFLLSFLGVFSNAQTTATLHGQIAGYLNSTVYLYSVSGLRQPPQLVDSAKLTTEFFTFKRVLKEPSGYYLSMNEVAGQLYFIWDKDIVVLLNSNELDKSTVEGSPTTEAWRSFVENVQAPYDQQVKVNRELFFKAQDQKDTARVTQLYQEAYALFMNHQKAITEYIQSYHDSWAGLYVLASCYKDMGRKSAQSLFAELSSSLQQSELGKQISATITDPDYMMRP